ncbi:MAG: hypothetical protein B1H03_00420 [Planctomycetales bacterium 4484_113]|nr:MAG: hypothetical protein B1H03_00420 [Planctomycetales bacterium 4484_113]
MVPNVLSLLVQVYIFVIFIYILLPWITPQVRYRPWYRSLGQLVEPYLGIFRRFIPPVGMLDLSPMAAILVLIILETALERAGL